MTVFLYYANQFVVLCMYLFIGGAEPHGEGTGSYCGKGFHQNLTNVRPSSIAQLKAEIASFFPAPSLPPLRAENDGVPATLKPSATCDNPKYLRILLEMCFVQFQDVVAAHRILLDHLKKAKQTYKGVSKNEDCRGKIWGSKHFIPPGFHTV